MLPTTKSHWFALALICITESAMAPSHLSAQYSHQWNAQLEGYMGWLLPSGDMTQLASGGGEGVRVGSTLAWGARALLPITGQPDNILGRVSLGFYGLIATSADMTSTTSQTQIGTSDYYQATGLLSTGHFIPASPINMTFTGMVGAGVGHRVFQPDAGVDLIDEDNSSTALVLLAALGVDMSVHARFSLVADAGLNLGIRDRSGETVVERSFPVRIGLGVRF